MPSLPDFSSLAPYVHSVTDQPIIHQVIAQPPLAWGTAGGAGVLGLILGFALRRPGRKWRRRYEQESEFYAAYRHQADDTFRTQKARIAELEAQLAAKPAPVPAAEQVAVPEPVAAVDEPPVTVAEPMVAVAEPVAVEPAPPMAPDHAPEPIAPVAAVEPPAPAPEPVAVPAWAVPVPDMSQITATAAPVEHTPEPAADDHPEPTHDAAPAVEGHAADKLTRLRGLDEGLAHKLSALGVTRFEDIEKLSAEDEIALEERLGVPAGFIAREQWRSQAALLRAGNETEFNERYALVDA